MNLKTILAAAISTTFLAACGGGGGGDSTPIPSSAASAASAASAPVSSGGSIAPVATDAAINAAVDLAKANISAMMKDPSSTTFQKLATYRIGSDDTVCGEVNAKNGFGAYVGYKAFYYRPKTYSPFTFTEQTTTTGLIGSTVDAAAATLIATVCSTITSAQADTAQTTYLTAVQKAYGL